MKSEYNLLDERWIIVTRLDGNLEKVSLLELFQNAHIYKSFDGECETQNISIIRLCLAVLTTVISRFDLEGKNNPIEDDIDATTRWGEWWNRKSFPIRIISEYLEQYRFRFYLFDEQYPFYQDASVGQELAMEYKKVTGKKRIADVSTGYYPLTKLIGNLSESANKKRLFKAADKNSIEFDEAARWLINYMNTADKPEKKPTPKNCGIIGEMGCVYCQGKSIFETLMLNLIPGADGSYVEKPEWEKTSPTGNNEEIFPSSKSELYTFQIRRLFLDRRENLIVGFKSKAGMCYNSLPLWEPMTMWRIQSKNSIEEIRPKHHDPSVVMWRNLSLLLASTNDSRKPEVIRWIETLENQDIFDSNYSLSIKTAGIEYGSMSSSISNTFYDSLSFSAVIIREQEKNEQSNILKILELTNDVADRFAYFCGVLYVAQGGDKEGESGVRRKSKSRMYSALDLPFRRWLLKVGTEYITAGQIENSWWEIIQRISLHLADEEIRKMPVEAMIGKMIWDEKKKKNMIYSGAKALEDFHYEISKPDRVKEVKNGKKK
ncbi:MAG: type I-E CRISPR-associated protein Cse1/CasA [Clostridiales bacterium]|nr:type I-E CRISPR-associated protein Cse1/CasA [Clostridiales bacterium]